MAREAEIPVPTEKAKAIIVSIGVIAWNEEKTIGPALESLFRQSIFEHLSRRNYRCEIICLANGCTDRTLAVASDLFAEQTMRHPFRQVFCCKPENIIKRGKINAWNQFVHEFSAPEAAFLFLMDADILIQGRETLQNMVATLEENSEAMLRLICP